MHSAYADRHAKFYKCLPAAGPGINPSYGRTLRRVAAPAMPRRQPEHKRRSAMCGRYVRFTPLRQLLPQFGVRPERIDDKLPGGYNIAPGQNILVVREDTEQGRTYGLLRWGLIPSWAKDPAIGHRMINARAEGVADKPAFRAAFRSRRCLVPADGFYEWAKKGNQRQPYYFQRRDRGSLAFAGLWERWHGNGGVVESCTIITTSANATLRSIHERMPVILAPEDYDL